MVTISRGIAVTALAALSALAGCASDVVTDVSAYKAPANAAGSMAPASLATGVPRTFAFERNGVQRDTATRPAIEDAVTQALSAHGLTPAPAAQADYRVAIAYATRRAAIDVAGRCEDAAAFACGEAASGPKTTFFGKPRYLHSLTIRLVDRTSGMPAYKVAATTSDDQKDVAHAIPYLVHAALDRFPLDNGAALRVKLPVGCCGH